MLESLPKSEQTVSFQQRATSVVSQLRAVTGSLQRRAVTIVFHTAPSQWQTAFPPGAAPVLQNLELIRVEHVRLHVTVNLSVHPGTYERFRCDNCSDNDNKRNLRSNCVYLHPRPSRLNFSRNFLKEVMERSGDFRCTLIPPTFLLLRQRNYSNYFTGYILFEDIFKWRYKCNWFPLPCEFAAWIIASFTIKFATLRGEKSVLV